MMALRRYEIVIRATNPELVRLDVLAERAGIHPALVERFVECGLVEPVERHGTVQLFHISAVRRLRTIVRLRETLGINLAGIAVLLDLLDRVSALQQENEWLRSRL